MYGRYRLRAAAGILKVTCEAVKSELAAEFGSDGVRYEEKRAMCRSSESEETVELWGAYAVRSYLAVGEGYFLESMKRRLEAVLDCLIACGRPDETTFEMLR